MIPATVLEMTADAHVAAMCSFVYPSDTAVRETAMVACALVGVNWVESVAATMELGATAHEARLAVAANLHSRMLALLAAGAVPRSGVGSDGYALDAFGFAADGSGHGS